MLSAAAQNRGLGPRRIVMPDAARLAEINGRIAVIRKNLSELTEQAATRSGAADEGLTADRFAEQEATLASLVKERDTLLKP
jgi:hypothetical protein